jgi:hypothetical protein
MEDGVNVTALPCYPSWHPDSNSDPSQHWLWQADATVRPAQRPDLCLTVVNVLPSNMAGGFVQLQPCVDAVTQHFAWHGPGVGESGKGWIYMGDEAYALGLILGNSSALPALRS